MDVSAAPMGSHTSQHLNKLPKKYESPRVCVHWAVPVPTEQAGLICAHEIFRSELPILSYPPRPTVLSWVLSLLNAG